jgi:hypothetical protein
VWRCRRPRTATAPADDTPELFQLLGDRREHLAGRDLARDHRLGIDPVDAGPLENGKALGPDGSPFAVAYSADQLAQLVAAGAAYDVDRGRPCDS